MPKMKENQMEPDIAQKKASNPYVSAWVSASAGSGKTKVLADRVLNLMLMTGQTDKILCLTFTKVAAAEMANRTTHRLRVRKFNWGNTGKRNLGTRQRIICQSIGNTWGIKNYDNS